MKLALNGALTIGTLDGANIEIRDDVGAENMFIFGLTAERWRRAARPGMSRCASSTQSRAQGTLDLIESGFFSPDRPDDAKPVIDRLLSDGEPFLVLADYAAYARHRIRSMRCMFWRTNGAAKPCINCLNMGYFSSDREHSRICGPYLGSEPVDVRRAASNLTDSAALATSTCICSARARHRSGPSLRTTPLGAALAPSTKLGGDACDGGHAIRRMGAERRARQRGRRLQSWNGDAHVMQPRAVRHLGAAIAGSAPEPPTSTKSATAPAVCSQGRSLRVRMQLRPDNCSVVARSRALMARLAVAGAARTHSIRCAGLSTPMKCIWVHGAAPGINASPPFMSWRRGGGAADPLRRGYGLHASRIDGDCGTSAGCVLGLSGGRATSLRPPATVRRRTSCASSIAAIRPASA